MHACVFCAFVALSPVCLPLWPHRRLLPLIKHYGEVEVGANREKQLTFFSTEMDVLANNDLGHAILSAILSDCDKTVDAINLAVRVLAVGASSSLSLPLSLSARML